MAIVTDGLLAYWNSKQGVSGTTWANIAPATVGNYDATLVGATITTDGTRLDGVDDHLIFHIPTEIRSIVPTTFEFRLKLSNYSAEPDVIMINGNVMFFTRSSGFFSLGLFGISGALNAPLVNGNEYFISMVSNPSAGTFTVYVNGVSTIAATGYQSILKQFANNATATQWITSNNGYYPNGIFDNVRFYNRALSPAEIAQNYAVGSEVGLAEESSSIQLSFPTEQAIYKQDSVNHLTTQQIYKQATEQINTKQSIYRKTTDNYIIKQVIYNAIVELLSTKQLIHKITTEDFQTLQTIVSPLGYLIDFPIRQIIHKQSLNTIPTTQNMYSPIAANHSTKQIMYISTQRDFTTRQVLFKQLISDLSTKQGIFKQVISDFTTQQIITAITNYIVDFATKQIIHKQSITDVHIEQSIYEQVESIVLTQQDIFKQLASNHNSVQLIFKPNILDATMEQKIYKLLTQDSPINTLIYKSSVADLPLLLRFYSAEQNYNQEIHMVFYINREITELVFEITTKVDDLEFKINREVEMTFTI